MCVHAHFIVAIEIMILCADFVLETLRLLTTCLTVSLPLFLSASFLLCISLSSTFTLFFSVSLSLSCHICLRLYVYSHQQGERILFLFFYIFGWILMMNAARQARKVLNLNATVCVCLYVCLYVCKCVWNVWMGRQHLHKFVQIMLWENSPITGLEEI